EGFKEKKATNLLRAIQKSKGCECYRFINALAIEHIGEVASKKICKSYGLDFFAIEDLEEVDGFGREMAESFYEFMRVNEAMVKQLLSLIEPKVVQVKQVQSSVRDKVFVITGTLSKPRNSYKQMLENLGAKVTGSVSKNTDYLLCGEDAGSKLTKAKNLGVVILDETGFKELIDG
ncbi:MAG: BRCT domain-containing protein, partial [Campylobacterota bacterium]